MSVGTLDTLGKAITHLSKQMNDQRQNKKFARWTRADWMEYFNRGLMEIGAYRPDAFTTTTKIKLVAGAKQSVPEGVTIDAIGPDQNGNIATTADSETYKAFATYAKCKPKPEVKNGKIVYAVKSVSIDKDDPSIFYVSPPVPAGIDVEVDAKAIGQPPQYTLADWNKPIAIASKYFNSLCEYATACAYKLDTESQISQRLAQQLFANFYQVMGVKYRMDTAFNLVNTEPRVRV